MFRPFALLSSLLLLAACAANDEVLDPPVALGNFTLGHNVVVAPRAMTSSTVSREVSEEELTTSLKAALAKRLERYEGTRQYHLGVSVEGYILARGGVPVVAAPKSAMILLVTVWDDEKGEKLNVPPEQITVLEDLDGESLFGSGWLQSGEEQLDGLSSNAAAAIESFLLAKNEERGWFEDEEEAARRIAASEAAAARAEADRRNDAPPPSDTPSVRVEPLELGGETPAVEELSDAADSDA